MSDSIVIQSVADRNSVPDYRLVWDPGWTGAPNLLIDYWVPRLGGGELKITCYVCRHTYGYHEPRARISEDRFLRGTFRKDGRRLDWGAGVKRDTLREGLASLIGHGLLTKESQRAPGGGDAAPLYSLDLAPQEEVEPPEGFDDFHGTKPYRFTQVPNVLFDRLLPHLTGAELKVLLLILRWTYDKSAQRAEITKGQMIEGTALSRRTVDRAVGTLQEKGIIYGEARTSASGDPEPTRYGLVMSEGLPPVKNQPLPPSKTDMGPRQKPTPPPVKNQPHEIHVLKTHETQGLKQQPSSKHVNNDVVVALTNMGMTRKIVEQLTREYPANLICTQIDMLPYRPADDPAAVLVKAIREEWAPPAAYQTPEQREAEAREAERIEAELEAWRQTKMASRETEDAAGTQTRRQVVEFRPFQAIALDSRRVWAMAVLDLKNHDGADAYLRGTRLLAREGDELVVGTGTAYAAEWLQRRIAHRAAQLLSALGGERVDVRFVAEVDWLSQP